MFKVMAQWKMPLINRLIKFFAGRKGFTRFSRLLWNRPLAIKVRNDFGFYVWPGDDMGPTFFVCHGDSGAFFHYEEDEKLQILRHLPDDGVFVDAGANIGLVSAFLARALPHASVFAFEPEARNAECLERTGLDNALKRLEVVRKGLSNEEKKARFYLHGVNAGGHSFVEAEVPKDSPYLEVEMTTLDRFKSQRFLEKIDFLKVDVQGAELDLLDGAKEVLALDRPGLLLELDNHLIKGDPEYGRRLRNSLEPNRYRVYSFDQSRWGNLDELLQGALGRDDRQQSNFMFIARQTGS